VRDTLELVDEFRRHGTEITTISDGFDLSGPAAEIVLRVMAWAAKMERIAINERIAVARERVEAEGGSWGRPTRLDQEARGHLAQLRRDGKSIRQIAIQLGVSKSAVARALRMSPKHKEGNAHLAGSKCSLSQEHESAPPKAD
jgi:DNA invertase Pin-like site-specific DNA recombinase